MTISGPSMSRRRFLIGGAVIFGTAAVAACAPAQSAAPTAASTKTSSNVAQPTATTASGTSRGAQPAATAAAQNAAPGKVVWMVRTTPAENQGQAKIFLPAMKKQYPNIQVERIIVPQANYGPKIFSMAAAKEALNIWGFGGNYIGYWALGMCANLNPFISADKWDIKSYFQPGFPETFNIAKGSLSSTGAGEQFGLPQQTTYGSVMVYNKTLFNKAEIPLPPVDWTDSSWTFDKMTGYAQKLTKDFGTPNAQYGVNWVLWDEMTSISYLEGADSWPSELYTTFIAPKTTFNNPGNIAGHQLRHDLMYKYKVHPNPAMSQGISQLGDAFLTGKVAMEMDGGWLYWTTFSIKDFEYGFAAIPNLKANKTINFTDFWIMGSWPSNKEDSWKIMRVLTDVQPVIDYSVFSGSPPAVVKATDSWLQSVAKRTGQPLADLKKVTLGAIAPERSQQSPDHTFVQYAKITNQYTQIIAPFWVSETDTAAKIWPSITSQMDSVVSGIFKQYNGKLPTN